MKETGPPLPTPNGETPNVRPRRLESSLYIFAAFIALLGLGDSIYLTVQHLTGAHVDCVASADCETVLGSTYAAVGKVPLAAFGALAYFGVFSLATLAAFGHGWTRPLFLWLVLAMLGCTGWLLYIQAFVLRSFCDFCLLSAALTAILSAIVLAIFLMRKRAARGLPR